MKRSISTNSRILSDIFADYPNTFVAFCELINNSIQANARNIFIKIDQVAPEDMFPTPIRMIEIKDDGVGVSESEFDKKILVIGTDVKKGGRGIGRLSALQIGSNMQIETIAYDQKKEKFTKVVLPINFNKASNKLLTELDFNTIEETFDDSQKTYYKVTINNLYDSEITEKDKKKKIDKGLLLENISDALFERYPSHIFNEEVFFHINDIKIDWNAYLIGEPNLIDEEYIDLKGDKHKIEFNFYNIKSSKSEIKIFLTVENAGIKTVAGTFEYSAEWLSPKIGSWFIYIYSDVFTINFLRNLNFAEMDEDQKTLRKFLKNKLDDFFKEKNKDYEEFQEELKKDAYYPYTNTTPTSISKQQAFDKIAYIVEDKYHLLNKNDSTREIIYPLIDQSISSGHIKSILQSILKLDEEYLIKFNELLEKSDLESIIEFSESVASKNQFIDFLFQIVYQEPAKCLRERNQLHKIVEKNLWIFGDRYAHTPFISLYSDKKLQNTLDELREKYFKYEPNENDDNLISLEDSELNNITDLFFYNEKILDDDKREIMIVELKAPKCKIGRKELAQIDNYQYHIEKEGVFAENRKYKLILISSDVSDFAKSKIGVLDENKPFLYSKSKAKDIETWVFKWSDLIEENKRKLSFLGEALRTKDIDVIAKFEKDFAEIDIENLKTRRSKLSHVKS